MRRQSVHWDKKITFEGMFESIINNYDTRLGSGFNSFIVDEFNKIPSEEVNLNNFIKLSAIQAKDFRKMGFRCWYDFIYSYKFRQ